MQLAIAIVTAVVSLAGLVYKLYASKKAAAVLEAAIVKETIRADTASKALERERSASKERSVYAKSLEDALRNHLKACNQPLAEWANSLGVHKPSKG